MNRQAWAVSIATLFLSFGTAWAGTDPSAAVPAAAPAGASFSNTAATASAASENAALVGTDRNRLEGWINGIDYRNSSFRMLDTRGFQTRVTTKPGIIGDFRMGDKVRVQMNPDYKRAETIEKLYA